MSLDLDMISADNEDGAESLSQGSVHWAECSRSLSARPGTLDRASSFMSEGQASVHLFYRLNHARQTLSYVKRQAMRYSRLSHGSLGVWEALQKLDTLREYETALLDEDSRDAEMPLLEHACQTAENCRRAFPDLDWLHLVGLLHGLGKLLAHKDFGHEPQWSVAGESFPVGCQFSPTIVHSEFFSANPDRRMRTHSSPCGVYAPGCGLSAVFMSWSAAEYLYLVLLRNGTRLPPEALFLIRHQKFLALDHPSEPYAALLSPSDALLVPWLRRFRELSSYKRCSPPGGAPAASLSQDPAIRAYYDCLIAKYIPMGQLRW